MIPVKGGEEKSAEPTKANFAAESEYVFVKFEHEIKATPADHEGT